MTAGCNNSLTRITADLLGGCRLYKQSFKARASLASLPSFSPLGFRACSFIYATASSPRTTLDRMARNSAFSLVTLVILSFLFSVLPTAFSGPVYARTSPGDISQYLSAHNTVRAHHGAVDLKWDDTLANAAQKWANGCQFKHSGGTLGPYGGKHRF